MNLSDADLALMTPAEREAYQAGDDDADLAVLEDIAGEDGDSDSADKPQDTSKADAPAATEQADDDTPTALYTAPGVEGYDAKVEAAEARKDEAFKKMMEGELSDAEYRAIEKEVSAEIRNLDRAMSKAEISAEMNQQAAANAWVEYVQSQVESEKRLGVDITSNPELMNELDRTVKLIARQVQEDPNMVKHLAATKPGALITNVDKWILSESMAILKARHNLSGKTAPKASRDPDLSGVPPTLSRVPVAAESNTGGDEFASMRNLTGVEYERAIARLTPDQLDRFLAS